MHELIVSIMPEHKEIIDNIRQAMEAYFGVDERRIAHAHAVAGHARELLAYVDADPVLTLAVAYLHDIGIHEAERRHGSNAGNFQEIEGPPIARRILEELGAEPVFIEEAARIIGCHHTPGGVDKPEFRVLWDADALVNFVEALPGKPSADVDKILRSHMVTEAGFRIARRLFLADRPDFPG
jgi:HD superfamily phosphodiesterase